MAKENRVTAGYTAKDLSDKGTAYLLDRATGRVRAQFIHGKLQSQGEGQGDTESTVAPDESEIEPPKKSA